MASCQPKIIFDCAAQVRYSNTGRPVATAIQPKHVVLGEARPIGRQATIYRGEKSGGEERFDLILVTGDRPDGSLTCGSTHRTVFFAPLKQHGVRFESKNQ
ncbi:MAG: hypothetical protein ACRD28_13160 [Acidobacteriaceae bacterium]